MKTKLFSEEHQWIEIEDDVGIVGISAYAVEELGKITFVDLPAVGMVLAQGEPLCVVESAKAASDVFAPVSGTVIAVNERLEEDPERINASPEQDGWICKLGEIDSGDLDALMDEEEYESYIADSADADL